MTAPDRLAADAARLATEAGRLRRIAYRTGTATDQQRSGLAAVAARAAQARVEREARA